MKARIGTEWGVATPIVAISLVVVLVSTSFTVDLGRHFERKRTLQLVADVAALDAARVMTDAPVIEQYAAVHNAAQASAARNASQRGGATLEVELVDAEGNALPADSTIAPVAVRVVAEDHVRFLFQPGGKRARARATAQPGGTALARMQLGSGLLALGRSWSETPGADDVDLLNRLATSLLGSPIELDAVSYSGLAATSLSLADIALAAGVGTNVESLLDTDLTLSQLFGLAIDAVGQSGQGAESAPVLVALDAYRRAANVAVGLLPVRLGDLLVIEPDTPEAAYGKVRLSLDQLVQGAVLLGRDGTVVSVPGLELGVPGLANLETRIGIVEPARTVVGPAGSYVETAQVRVSVSVTVNALGLGAVHVPLVVQSAIATARFEDIRCASGEAVSADLRVDTRGAQVMLGNVANLAGGGQPVVTPASIATLLGLVDVRAATSIPIAERTHRIHLTVNDWGRPIRVGSAANLGRTQLDAGISLLGIPLLPALLPGALNDLLDGVVVPVVNAALGSLVEPLLSALGVQLSYADVVVSEPDCTISPPRLIS